MKVLDLFSGIGGFSLGLERAGMETVAFCEKAEFQRKVLEKHWPSVPIYEDVRTLDVTGIKADVYAGGAPCTQTSVAAAISGCRHGLKGKDSGLWHRYLELVGIGRPAWVIYENPPGIQTWEGEIKSGLEGFGYRVSKLAFKASDFGLPHRRIRCFYVANANGKGLEITRQTRPQKISWIKRLTATGGAWVTSTPGAIGMFNGLPNRVDRTIALGNAVMPCMAEEVGRLIMEAEQ